MLEPLFDLIIRGGPWVMVPLCWVLALLWYGLGYRVATLRRGSKLSIRQLFDRAWAGTLDGDGVLVRAANQAVVMHTEPNPRLALDATFRSISEELGRGSTLVRTLVIIAPLTGLLGTVMGMIETFSSLGQMAMFARSGGISGGISQALITTQLGLAVAIPGLVLGRLLDRKQQHLSDELEELKDHFLSHTRKAA